MDTSMTATSPVARPWLQLSVTPVVQAARGEIAAWGVVVPIGTVTIVVLVLLGWLLTSMTSTAPRTRCDVV